MKYLSITSLLLLSIISCQGDPSKKAENEAENLTKMAENEAQVADAQMNASADNATASVVHATQAELNTAIAGVQVPKFDKKPAANELVKKIGNLAVEFINANNYDQAQTYANKLNDEIQQISAMQAGGKLTADEADQIKQYCRNVGSALQLTLSAQ